MTTSNVGTTEPPTVEIPVIALRPPVHPGRRRETLLDRFRVRALAVAVPLGAAAMYFHAVAS